MSPIYLPLYADAEYINPEETPNHLFEQPIEINGKYNFIEYNPGHPEEGIIPQYIENQEENQEEEEIEDYDLYINVSGSSFDNNVAYIALSTMGAYIATNYLNNYWTFYDTTTSLTSTKGYELLIIEKTINDSYYIRYYYDISASQYITINQNSWVFNNNSSYGETGRSVYFFNINGNVLLDIRDYSNDTMSNPYDKYYQELHINSNLINFNISWMTFN